MSFKDVANSLQHRLVCVANFELVAEGSGFSQVYRLQAPVIEGAGHSTELGGDEYDFHPSNFGLDEVVPAVGLGNAGMVLAPVVGIKIKRGYLTIVGTNSTYPKKCNGGEMNSAV